jgi:hypothetical protein
MLEEEAQNAARTTAPKPPAPTAGTHAKAAGAGAEPEDTGEQTDHFRPES